MHIAAGCAVWSVVRALISSLTLTYTGSAIKHPKLEIVRVTSRGIFDLRSVVAATCEVSDRITTGQCIPVGDVSGWFSPGAPPLYNTVHQEV